MLISELWGSGSQVDGSALIMTRGKGLYMYIYVNKVFVPYFNVFNDVSFWHTFIINGILLIKLLVIILMKNVILEPSIFMYYNLFPLRILNQILLRMIFY